MKKQRIHMTTGYTIAIFALLLVGFLLVVIYGAKTYGNTVESQRESNNQRAVLSYISTNVRNHDHSGGVSIEQGPQGDMLVLKDEIGETVYLTKIYVQDGVLVEEYGKDGMETGTGQLQEIGDCGALQLEQQSAQSIWVRTDAGSMLLHLRSESGGMP